MTVAWAVARIAAVTALLVAGFALLPPASIEDATPLVIPDYVWNPLVGVLSLDRLLPIRTLLTCAAFALAVQAGMAAWWLGSWILRHIGGSS